MQHTGIFYVDEKNTIYQCIVDTIDKVKVLIQLIMNATIKISAHRT